MKRSSNLARSGPALALALLFTFASSAEPTKKPPVDFNAQPTAGIVIGPLGVVVKIQSASIASDGTITARLTIKDSAGNPLDRLGVATAGPVTISLIAAYIPAGKTQYLSYSVNTAAATINTNPTQHQAANDSGGTWTANALGDYTYKFSTKAPTTFDTKATHAIGVSAQRDLSAFGTFDEWSQTGNDVYTFVPSGSAVPNPRQIVATQACNGCHNPMIGHGGSRITVELCILCHQPQSINPDTELSMDMPVLIHKLHMGSSLPSVKAGTPYRVWHRGAWSDFSTVVFPMDVRNCTACHNTVPQADNWKTNPTLAACTSCHDDVNPTTGVNHVNLPVASEADCKTCHTSTVSSQFDASIPGAHTIPNYASALPGLVTKIVSVTNAVPGSAPTVTFSVLDKSGNPVDISKLTYVRVVLAGPNVDYQVGPGGIRASEDPTKTAGSNGTYAYTMTNVIPPAAAGSYTVSIEARNNVTLLPGTTQQMTGTDIAAPVETYFSVDKSTTVARRQVVALAKCASCHVDLNFVHSGGRGNTQECVMCHNPTLTDGTSKLSVNYATQIHSIHRGEDLANPYVLGTTNYQSVRFPGDLRDCTTCHVNSSYQVDNVGAVASVATTGAFTPTTPPISAACQGCHDDKATASHALANTTALGESCVTCHGINGEFAVDTVHKR